MSFIEVLESEYKWIVEAIEHESSDREIIENLINILFIKTGYKYTI